MIPTILSVVSGSLLISNFNFPWGELLEFLKKDYADDPKLDQYDRFGCLIATMLRERAPSPTEMAEKMKNIIDVVIA